MYWFLIDHVLLLMIMIDSCRTVHWCTLATLFQLLSACFNYKQRLRNIGQTFQEMFTLRRVRVAPSRVSSLLEESTYSQEKILSGELEICV